MKILYIANVSDLYGASRSLLRLATQVVRDGHRAEALLPEEGPLRERLELAGVKVQIHADLPIVRGRVLRSPWECLRLAIQLATSTFRLVRHIRTSRPDVIHTNSAVILSPGLAACISRTPHVWHVREFMQGVNPLWRLYQWMMAGLASVIVCNSRAVAGQFCAPIRKRKVVVIYNGIAREEIVPAAAERVSEFRRKHALQGEPLVGVVGRIQLEQKGQDDFVQAAAMLSAEFPAAGFIVAGSPFPGNEGHLERLRRRIEDLGLAGRVACTGDVEDVAALYSTLDICVLPAKKPEGLGNVLIEAMAVGKPVVGTATGGIPEIIEHGRNGFVVGVNDPESLAAAIRPLLTDAELRRRMGQAGRERFEALFELVSCYRKMHSLYSGLSARSARAGGQILGMKVDATSYQDAADRIFGWARAGQSRYVCCASVNNVMEAHDSREFQSIMNDADLVTPDGMPLVWGLRMLGSHRASRVYGPDLMRALLQRAEAEKAPVGFYGGAPGALVRLISAVRRRHPGLEVAYSYSPPFRPLTPDEDEIVVRRLRDSGAHIVFVGLSTPKQEHWMAAHRGRIPAVMLGVGAAFDFLAGIKPQAPPWMQQAGLEWSFRLATEPRRLWRRYLKHNPRFAALFALQFLERELTT